MGVSQLYGSFRATSLGFLVSVASLFAAPLIAQDRVGPALAAASNFGQGWRVDIFENALQLPVTDFRDAVYWNDTDDGTGVFAFTEGNTLFPDLMAAQGQGMSLTVNNGHPSYDDGVTPHTPEAIAAFAAHAAAMVQRFPAIHTVEVGNEINSENFVSGPVKDAGLPGRAAGYLPLLIAVHDAVKAVRPEVKILGAGVHSIPVGYIDGLMALGAAPYMDAIAIHPYTTPAEQLVRQIDIMRAVPGLETMPIEVTEFGSEDPDEAPGHLIRSYCQMGLAGVTRIVWYALNERGDGLIPLIDTLGGITKAGQAYQLAQDMFEGQKLRAYRPDQFTYGCWFGEDTLVIWGADRALTVARDLRVLDALGTELDTGTLDLSETEPLILTANRTISEADFTLAPQTIIADSYHQFAYPTGEEPRADGDPFERYAQSPNGLVPLITMPGQERDATLWTPYRGSAETTHLRLTADSLLPSGDRNFPVEIVHRHVFEADATVSVETNWNVPARSVDGIKVTIALGDLVLVDKVVENAETLVLPNLAPKAGDVLSVTVGPNDTPNGDVANYRITIRRL